MTLVERLRACSGAMSDDPECNCLEAAAEIERLNGIMEFAAEASRHERDGLRAEVARLRAVLREALLYGDLIGPMESWWRKVRAALEPKP